MSIIKKLVLWILALFFVLNVSTQKFDQLVKTPPMGCNSWNKYACDISEKTIMQMADAMVSTGIMDAGYNYFVLTKLTI